MELYLPPRSTKRKYRPAIVWTGEMIERIRREFPTSFNRELSGSMGISLRSLIRKARELGVYKEPCFLENRRKIITDMAVANNHNSNTGRKGWFVPNSEASRFKPGHVSPMVMDPELKSRIHQKRNRTIKRERIRISLGLPQKTKLKLR